MAIYPNGICGQFYGRIGNTIYRRSPRLDDEVYLTPRRDARTPLQLAVRKRFQWYTRVWPQLYHSHLQRIHTRLPRFVTAYAVAMDASLSLPLDSRMRYPLAPVVAEASVISGWTVVFYGPGDQRFRFLPSSWRIPGTVHDMVFLLLVRDNGTIWFVTPFGQSVGAGEIPLPELPPGGEAFRTCFVGMTHPDGEGGYQVKHLSTSDRYYYPN